ncbi:MULTISPECIES: DUF6483 family protein [unclassified Paenibacillus]|nr:DUF6483 family protein [Paenibacillus sp. 7541]
MEANSAPGRTPGCAAWGSLPQNGATGIMVLNRLQSKHRKSMLGEEGDKRMYRRDYLVRLVEDMTKLIAHVFRLKQERKHTEALQKVEDLLRRQFRLNSKLLGSLSASDIEKLFHNQGFLDADSLQSAARMLEEEADILMDMGREEEAVLHLTKVLELYLTAILHGADRKLLGLPQRIADVRDKLRAYAMPVSVERLYFTYTEQEGDFAEAENTLYRLLDQNGMAPDEARQFYQRLLQLEPEELERGGLPLDEVYEGMAELDRQYADSI